VDGLTPQPPSAGGTVRTVTETAPLVLHLNGAPGVGKSTLARRWADEHPGTLLLDVDVLRTWVSGWRDDFAATGQTIRPVALAMLTAYVEQERPIVLPQLLADPAELDRFRTAADRAGGRWLSVLVEADDAQARFAARETDEPHLEAVHRLVEDAGGDHLTAYVEQLEALADTLPGMVRLPTVTGDVAGSYAALVTSVG
jgi:predicted kinase